MSLSPSLELNLTPLAQREERDSPEKPVCQLCESNEVTFDATAWWDHESQSFEYDIADGNAFCLYCDEKQPVKWIPA